MKKVISFIADSLVAWPVLPMQTKHLTTPPPPKFLRASPPDLPARAVAAIRFRPSLSR